MDLLLPLHLAQARTRVTYLDATGLSRGMFGAPIKTAARGVDRLGMQIEMSGSGGGSSTSRSDRALVRAFLARLRGAQNRAYMVDTSYSRRGSFPTGELLTNNTFASGTTGWLFGSQISGTASDRTLRTARTAVTNTMPLFAPSSQPAVTQYAPYVARYFARGGRYSAAALRVAFVDNSSQQFAVTSGSTAFGMFTLAAVPYQTTVLPRMEDTSFAGLIAGDYVDFSYSSFSRCLLADTGTNLLLRSDELENTGAWGATNSNGLASVTANSIVAPDGTTTADTLTENTASTQHYRAQQITVPSSAADYCFYGHFKAKERGIGFIWVAGATDSIIAYLNLSTGVVSNAGGGPTSWANARAFARDMGNGWWQLQLVARKIDATTTLTCRYGMAQTAGAGSYTGDGTSGIYAWRLGAAASGVPVRPVQTTSAASNGTSPTGSTMYVKGGPASAAGSLLVDDQFEVITSRGSELKILTAPVDFDAAGLGYMQFDPPLRGTVADNAAVILHNPMMYALFTGNEVGWDNSPGFWTTASAEFEEAA